ncbi:MAG: PEP/pyruvate-binding domain-containing protein [Gammaproteobacteria bacterium]
MSAGQYRSLVGQLALVPAWAEQQLAFVFADGVKVLASIEPLASGFISDQLRASPLVYLAAAIDRLHRDANRTAGTSHQMFGRVVGTAVRALTAGIARGVLRDGRTLSIGEFAADGIYLLDESPDRLPPVAGMINSVPGNPLSHAQLLAREFGIPTIGVAQDLLEALMAHAGERVLLIVSAAGVIHLAVDTAPENADTSTSAGAIPAPPAREPATLDLTHQDIVDLSALRASDSGRIVGPKSARLGQLKAFYPAAVAGAVAVPFGAFRTLLERPASDGSGSMYDYVTARLRALEQQPMTGRAETAEALHQTLFDWIQRQPVPELLAGRIRAALEGQLGAHRVAVFIRSDSNVEDQQSFSGAGLNLTLPNVVGIDNILAAIPTVWASPYSQRAFRWRRARGPADALIYPAVLLQRSVNVEKSGVMITQDIDTGDGAWLSIATNEGVGGGVDGRAAEVLRVHPASGRVRLLAQATAPTRKQLNPEGGISVSLASGNDVVLRHEEIAQLISLAQSLPEHAQALLGGDLQSVAADIEFGFEQGRLRLFQIRPLADIKHHQSHAFMQSLGSVEPDRSTRRVHLDEPLD